MHNYPNHQLMSEHQILEKAAEIILTKFIDRDAFTDVNSSKQFLTFKELFWGTVDSATVHPRELVKAVLALNGSGVILAHNHPSGATEPSRADIKITQRLKDALALIDVRVLDHIVIGKKPVSFAERGLI